jgi:phospholipid/cholesterol/gamma-HCH transport system substrate-binding protein
MALKSFRDRNPYLVGLASVGGIAVLVAFAFFIGFSHILEHSYDMSGVFTDSGGIHGGDAVLVAGVKAGRVTGVKAIQTPGPCRRSPPDPNVVTPQGPNTGCVLVSWKVTRGIHLGSNTHADIVLETLLGTRALRLTGPVTTPFLDQMPAASRRIPIDRTEVPFDIADLVTVGTHNIEATKTTELNQLIGELANVTQGKRAQITTLLTSVSKVTDTLNARDAQLRDLLDRANRLSAQLADKDKTLVALIDDSQGILTEIQRRRADIAAGLNSGNAAVAELDRILAVDKATIDGALSALHPILNTVSARQADINHTLAALGPGLLTQGMAASHGPWADVFVKTIGPDLAYCAQVISGQPAPPGGQPAACQQLASLLKGMFSQLAVQPAPGANPAAKPGAKPGGKP